MTAALPFAFPLSAASIREKRAAILAQLLARDEGFSRVPVKSLRSTTLTQMLSLYDSAFFSGFLGRSFGRMDVTCSARLTSAAGKFVYTRNPSTRMEKAEIRMSSDFLFRLNEGPFTLNGLCVLTAQEAFLVVFEHELCHALETALYGSTGHSKRFLALANGLFGHTDIHHSLPTRKQEAAKSGIIVGSHVKFQYQSETLTGIVTYVGKTATVMVKDSRGNYRDKAGNRYAKYSVPLSVLSIK